MVVPMMQVWIVRMAVAQPFVPVPMGVRLITVPRLIMLMLVMFVVRMSMAARKEF